LFTSLSLEKNRKSCRDTNATDSQMIISCTTIQLTIVIKYKIIKLTITLSQDV